MPLPGSPMAPKTFDGDENEISDFLEHFLLCASSAQLPQEDHVAWFFKYLSREQKDIFRVFKGYKAKNWMEFEQTIKTEFRKAFEEKSYTRNTLIKFTEKAAQTVIKTEQQLREYHRKFQAIAQVLLDEELIHDDDSAACFWYGLHEQTRQQLLTDLRIKYPTHARKRPYPIANVLEVGENVFAEDDFIRNLPMDIKQANQNVEESRDNVATRIVQITPGQHADQVSDNIQGLMDRLQHLKVHEPEYAVMFNKIQSTNSSLAAVLRRPEMDRTCKFCNDKSHILRFCPTLQEYSRAGKILFKDGFWRFPNDQRIPGHPEGIKASVDEFYKDQTNTHTAPATNYFYTAEGILTTSEVDGASGEVSEVVNAFTAKTAPTGTSANARKTPQYQYHSKIEDPAAVERVYNKILDGQVILARDVLAVAPEVRKRMVEELKVTREPAPPSPTITQTTAITSTAITSANTVTIAPHMAPVRVLDVYVQGQHRVAGIYDPGAELVCISSQMVEELGLAYCKDTNIMMRDANGGTKKTYGIIEMLELTIAGVSLFVQAFIIDNPPYNLLLGRPFQIAGKIDTTDVGEVLLMKDPKNENRTIRIPTRPHGGPLSNNRLIIVEPADQLIHEEQPADIPCLATSNLLLASHLMNISAVFKYKPVL